MPVEFNCPTCAGRLRTPDGSEGKKAKCPKCEAIVDVPGEPLIPMSGQTPNTVAPPSGLSSLPTDESKSGLGAGSASIPNFSPAHANPTNPYAAPSGNPSIRPANLAAAGDIEVGSMLSSAWAGFRRAPGILIGATLLTGLFTYPPSILGQGLLEFSNSSSGDEAITLGIVGAIVLMIGYPIQIWMLLGQMRLGLDAARGEDLRLRTLFSCGSRILPCLGAYIVVGLLLFLSAIPMVLGFGLQNIPLSIIGTLILFFAVSYLWLACWPFLWLILERKAGVLDSLSAAAQLTKGHRFTSFIMMVVSSSIMFLGFLALLVGLFVAAPFVVVLWAVFYSRLVGEPTVTANDQSF